MAIETRARRTAVTAPAASLQPAATDAAAAATEVVAAEPAPAAAAAATSAVTTPVSAPRTTDGYRFWLVPHTHWDREWYLPFEQFRIRLARVVDEIVDVLETDPSFRCFVLDGQAVVLEDYLEVRPHHQARFRRLIEAGRIAIGPSYILPDEYLVSGESLVRNLLLGRQVCEAHGGRPMAAGYLPDTFGHVEQLPQILRGFGLETFIFWRGLGDEANEVGPLFRWRGPDGTEVLAVRQLGSYGNADEFGRWGRNGANFKDQPDKWPEIAALRFERYLEMFGNVLRAHDLRDVMLCNGSDHKPIMRDLPMLLDAAFAAHQGASGGIATYDEYVAHLRDALAAEGRAVADLPLREGELCGGKDSNVLRGVNSARIELKQANEATQQALFVAETLAALAELRARAGLATADAGLGVASPVVPYRYPLDELRQAWRYLLLNQPHDSISGCSTDAVHRDMAQRYVSARQIADRVRAEALSALAGRTEPWYPVHKAAAPSHGVVNVLPWQRTGLVELEIPADLRGAIAAEADGAQLPVQFSGPRRALVAATIPGFAGRTVTVRRARPGDDAFDSTGPTPSAVEPDLPARAPQARAVDERTIENDRYRVHVLENGSLLVTDLRDGRAWPGMHRFEDVGDRGDEYTFDPVAGDIAWTSDRETARVAVIARGPAAAELQVDLVARLPRALTPDRTGRARGTVRCPIRTVVRLVAGGERIEFRTTIDNRARDHRLRVVFAAPGAPTTVRAEGHFGLVRRPALPVSDGDWWEEPALTHHTSGAVAAGDLTVLTRGLPEYQAVLRADGLDVALTLVRAVGWLSREDLTTRREGAGPSVETPEAQCLGVRFFEYAIDLDGGRPDASILRASLDFRTDLVVGPAGADPAGLLTIDGDDFAFGGLKGAEDRDGTIVRLFAGADRRAAVRVAAPGNRLAPCRLDETPLDAVPVGETADRGSAAAAELPGRLTLSIAPARIDSLRLRPSEK